MAAESCQCHPRGLSWFARSCIPADPARHIAVPVPISAASATNTNTASDTEESPISALPDELLLECLARVPRASLPPLPAVCWRFATLLASEGFLHLRRAHGRLRPCLLAVSVSSAHGAATFARALLQLGASSRPDVEVAALPLPTPLLHCAGSSSSAFAHARAVALGRDVYLIGRGATLRVDALTGAARACAPTLFPRTKFAAAAVGARIYVAGGSARTAAVEEYDPDADAWRVVAEVRVRRRGGRRRVLRRRRGGGVRARRGRSRRTRAPGRWTRCTWRQARGRGRRGRGRCPAAAASWAPTAPGTATSTWWQATWWTYPSGGGAAVVSTGVVTSVEVPAPPPVPRGSVGLGTAVRVAMAGVGGDRVAAVVNVAA
ncbi:hypothetical protein SETIT_8G024500v2, partial [Setaria italica]